MTRMMTAIGMQVLILSSRGEQLHTYGAVPKLQERHEQGLFQVLQLAQQIEQLGTESTIGRMIVRTINFSIYILQQIIISNTLPLKRLSSQIRHFIVISMIKIYSTYNYNFNIDLIGMTEGENAPKKQYQGHKSKSLDPYIGTSSYVINNSLYCAIQPKRTSFDVKLYMQLHRKLMRKAVIQKKFQESLYNFKNHIDYKKKGFKGKLKHQNFMHRSISEREKQKRLDTEISTSVIQNSNLTFHDKQEQVSINSFHRTVQAYNKPNMMYNLSLYRKGFKKHQIKNEKMCLNVIQTFNKVKELRENEGYQSRTKKLMTVV